METKKTKGILTHPSHTILFTLVLSENVSDVVKEGDEVSVKVVGFDRGKVKLSMKEALE